MHYAIIAAGEGSRLAQEGVLQPKPLISLLGQPMIGRLLNLMVSNHAESICIIVNRQMLAVQEYLSQWQDLHPDVRLQVLVKSTPSSMHSMAALCELLPEGRLVCTTVDTIFEERDFADYVQRFESCPKGVFLFGVTPFVEDEKPLWVETDAEGHISAFRDQGPAPYVSGGIYGMEKESILPVLDQCLASGQARMRNFQRALLSAGIEVRAHIFDKIMDIDHKEDIQHAEQWLSATEPPQQSSRL